MGCDLVNLVFFGADLRRFWADLACLARAGCPPFPFSVEIFHRVQPEVDKYVNRKSKNLVKDSGPASPLWDAPKSSRLAVFEGV